MKRRSTFGGALIGLGLAITSAGFLATAPGASAAQDPDMHCANHATEDKWNVPEGGGSTTLVVDGVPVTLTVSGGSVTFTDAEGDPIVVDYCLKAGTSNTGKQQGTSGNTNGIPNNGGNAPAISYVVVYSVPGPTTPTETTATVEPSETTATVEPSETTATVEPSETTATVEPSETTATVEPSETTATVLPTESTATTTATVLPTESTATVEPSESTATTTPTVLPTASTAPVDPETSTTPTVLPSSRTSSPAMVPTAVDAGLGGGADGQGVPSSLLIMFGAALAVLGLGIGFVPVVARGKHSH